MAGRCVACGVVEVNRVKVSDGGRRDMADGNAFIGRGKEQISGGDTKSSIVFKILYTYWKSGNVEDENG